MSSYTLSFHCALCRGTMKWLRVMHKNIEGFERVVCNRREKCSRLSRCLGFFTSPVLFPFLLLHLMILLNLLVSIVYLSPLFHLALGHRWSFQFLPLSLPIISSLLTLTPVTVFSKRQEGEHPPWAAWLESGRTFQAKKKKLQYVYSAYIKNF